MRDFSRGLPAKEETSLVLGLVESGEVVNGLKSGALAGTYRPISPQDAINRRFNGVLRRVGCEAHETKGSEGSTGQ